jgi:hypothetical protein
MRQSLLPVWSARTIFLFVQIVFGPWISHHRKNPGGIFQEAQ